MDIDLKKYDAVKQNDGDILLRLKSEYRQKPHEYQWITKGQYVNTGLRRDFHGDVYGYVVSEPYYNNHYSCKWAVSVEYTCLGGEKKRTQLPCSQLKKARRVVKYMDETI